MMGEHILAGVVAFLLSYAITSILLSTYALSMGIGPERSNLKAYIIAILISGAIAVLVLIILAFVGMGPVIEEEFMAVLIAGAGLIMSLFVWLVLLVLCKRRDSLRTAQMRH